MEDIIIIDKFVDKREFRNIIQSKLIEYGYYPVKIDDVRISDDNPINNNDLKIMDKKIKCTVQTFLNKKITYKDLRETTVDMEKEKVALGVIITNKEMADEEIINKAKELNIVILDRNNIKLDDYKIK